MVIVVIIKIWNVINNFKDLKICSILTMLSFNALKKEKSVRCGMTLCNNVVIDFIFDNKHDDCYCTNGLKEKIHSI